MDHPAFSNGLSDDLQQDPEFLSEYFSGAYDITCTECGGKGLVVIADEEKLNDSERVLLARYQEMISARRAEQRCVARGYQF